MSEDLFQARAALGKAQSLLYFTFTTFDYFKRCCSVLVKGLMSDDIYHPTEKSAGLKEDYLYGREFKTEEQWSRYLASKGLGMDEKSNMELSFQNKKSINEFKKLCRKYGVDIGVMNRPEDLDYIVQKANQVPFEELTTREQKVINAYTQKNMDGEYVAKPGAITIAFKTSDLGRITKIQERMEARQRTLQGRLEKVQEIKQKRAEKEKEKASRTIGEKHTQPAMER